MNTYQATHDDVLDALGDRTRRSVFELLAAGPRSVGELAEDLPVSRPAVSQHLGVLKRAGLVTDTKAGTRRLYRVDAAGLRELRTFLDSFWDEALNAFAKAAE